MFRIVSTGLVEAGQWWVRLQDEFLVYEPITVSRSIVEMMISLLTTGSGLGLYTLLDQHAPRMKTPEGKQPVPGTSVETGTLALAFYDADVGHGGDRIKPFVGVFRPEYPTCVTVQFELPSSCS